MLRKPSNYDDVQVTKTLDAGGYVLKIVKATYVPEKNYIMLNVDIHEGEFKGYFAKREFNGQWSYDAIKYLSLNENDKTVKLLKADITSIEKSNNFKFDWSTEKKLESKLVGGIFRKVQYQAKDGSLKFKVKLDRFRSVESIISGDFEVPEPKFLDLTEVGASDYAEDLRAVASFVKKEEPMEFDISDDDLPF